MLRHGLMVPCTPMHRFPGRRHLDDFRRWLCEVHLAGAIRSFGSRTFGRSSLPDPSDLSRSPSSSACHLVFPMSNWMCSVAMIGVFGLCKSYLPQKKIKNPQLTFRLTFQEDAERHFALTQRHQVALGQAKLLESGDGGATVQQHEPIAHHTRTRNGQASDMPQVSQVRWDSHVCLFFQRKRETYINLMCQTNL